MNSLSNIKKGIIVRIFVPPFIFKECFDLSRSQIVIFRKFFNLCRCVELRATGSAVMSDNGDPVIIFW